MPELPEVEITARLLDRALRGARIESARAPGINALKTYDPPLSQLEGAQITGVRRRGKHLIVDSSHGLSLLIHLMSAGRLQLYDRRAGPRDRTSRLLVGVRLSASQDAVERGGLDVAGSTSAAGASGAWSITLPGIEITFLSGAPCRALRAVRSKGGRSLPVRCPSTLRRRRKMKTASARKMMV